MTLITIPVTPVLLREEISLEEVTPSNSGILMPIAPLTTILQLTNDGQTDLFFRIVVFLDSENTTPPTFAYDSKNPCNFYVCFSLGAQVPKSYTAWYIESLYINYVGDSVTVYTQNADPRTSRGTETTVIVKIDG